MPAPDFEWRCPTCGVRLEAGPDAGLICPAENRSIPCVDGIRRFLPPERREHFETFVRSYAEVRRREGRGSRDDRYFRALPFRDLTGLHRREWRIRAKSFNSLVDAVIRPLADTAARALRIADLGAGNGWLSNRLTQLGHRLAAVDLNTDASDGLGAWPHYETSFERVQSEFDVLPFADASIDLVVFNGSFHYATDGSQTLGEALRVLRPRGIVAILDTPVYRNPDSGRTMVREMHETFDRQYGVKTDSTASIGYLTFDGLEDLGRKCGVHWCSSWPFYGIRWSLRPHIARIRGRREPASFGLLWAAKPGPGRR